MTKLNLNAIEGFAYITPLIKKRLESELEHIKSTQAGLNGRARRIESLLKKPMKPQRVGKKEDD